MKLFKWLITSFTEAFFAHYFPDIVVGKYAGETTEGAIDEAFRHAITKMSHLHFVSCEAYRLRVIQLGEAPDRVFNVGVLGVENIRRTLLMDRSELTESIGFSLEKPFLFRSIELYQSWMYDKAGRVSGM